MSNNMEMKHFVAGMIVEKEQILLVQSDHELYRGLWGLPGGIVENDETPEQALANRLYSQLNIHVAVGGKFGETEIADNGTQSSVACFFCTIQSGSIELKEFQDMKWIYLIQLSDVYYNHPIEGIIGFLPKDKAIINALFSPENMWRISNKPKHHRIHEKKIFEYAVSSAWGCLGEYGGSTFTLYKSGTMMLTKHLFGLENIPFYKVKIKADMSLVSEIQEAISAHKNEIQRIPDNLNNGSCDGAYYYFAFERKRISALNICRCDPDEVNARNPSYYEEYQGNLKCENMVMDLFDIMIDIINKHHSGISYSKSEGFHV